MDNNPSNDTTPKNSGQVMDIQPGAPAPAAPVTVTEPVTAAPVSNTELATPPTETSAVPEAPAADNVAEQPAMLAAEAPKAPHKKPLIPVLVAVVIGLALIGVASFAYIQQNKKPNIADSAQTAPKDEATPADVDTVNKAVDDDLSTTNPDADFDDATLSDTNLAL